MICNYCGDESEDCKADFVNGEYLSTILSDCTTYSFSLCEDCLGRMFLDFKIPPMLSGSLPPYSWKEERASIKKRLKNDR